MIDDSLEGTLTCNRAEKNERHISTKAFIKKFLTLPTLSEKVNKWHCIGCENNCGSPETMPPKECIINTVHGKVNWIKE